jgi:hypothetical protein
MISVTSIKTEIPTPNRNRFRSKACQHDAEEGMDDDELPGIIDEGGIGNIALGGIRPIGDLMISATDIDGSRVGTDWYIEVDDDGVDNEEDDTIGKLHSAVAATVGFFIIPQSITEQIQWKRKNTTIERPL